MSSFHGKVEAISNPNKAGYISFKVDGEWFGCGKKAPSFDRGAVVTFDAEKNDGGYWNADMKTLQVQKADAQKDSPKNEAGSAKSGFKQDPGTQASIEAQVALKAAAEVTVALIGAGRYKAMTDDEVDQQLAERTKHLYECIRKVSGLATPVSTPKPVPKAESSGDFDNELPPF